MKRIFSAFIVCLIFQISVAAQQQLPQSEFALSENIGDGLAGSD